MPRTPVPAKPGVHAVLGPTNTGKTHYAVERLIRSRSGIIGLPLRLLAREVYDRVKARVNADAVALVTGEEKIIPEHARYYVCTVESMPTDRGVEFVAVDEIQLCADPDRGHIFTDRLLRTRGIVETVFLGSASMEPRLRELVPNATITEKPRFSRLSYAGRTRLDRLPRRSAIVAFSAEDVYEIAEHVRRRKGGAAVVLGALSPRTRNAQVELFQSGEVDTIVATDAIGMGLNLEIDHVAFAGLVKFDGHVRRDLTVEELAQIAGRAGRHRNHGTFGVTGDADDIPARVFQTIETHRMPPVTNLRWRNARLEFQSLAALLASLNAVPTQPNLIRPRETADARALQILAEQLDVRDRTTTEAHVRKLWEACRLPDYPKVSPGHHAGIVGEIYGFLISDSGTIPDDWMAQNLERITTAEGTIATLSDSLAHARTWQYVANQSSWLSDADHWRERTRHIEDQISDALHGKLVERFIDRRAVALAKQQRAATKPTIALADDGAVMSDGVAIAVLDGFRFRSASDTEQPLSKPERAARNAVAETAVAHRVEQFLSCPDDAIEFLPPTGIAWQGASIAQLRPGPSPMRPEARPLVEDAARPSDVQRINQRLQAWLSEQIQAQFAPLIELQDDPAVTGLGQGIAFRLVEGLGVLPRAVAKEDIGKLTQDERAPLRRHGVRFGRFNIFLRQLIKPSPTRLRLILWGLAAQCSDVTPPPPGLNNLPLDPKQPADYYTMSGFHLCGNRAVRIDILERLHEMVDQVGDAKGFRSTREMISILGCSLEELREVFEGLGYRVDPAQQPAQSEDATGETYQHYYFHQPESKSTRSRPQRRGKSRTDKSGKQSSRQRTSKGAQPANKHREPKPTIATSRPLADLAKFLEEQKQNPD